MLAPSAPTAPRWVWFAPLPARVDPGRAAHWLCAVCRCDQWVRPWCCWECLSPKAESQLRNASGALSRSGSDARGVLPHFDRRS
jgi:hypothetical protein